MGIMISYFFWYIFDCLTNYSEISDNGIYNQMISFHITERHILSVFLNLSNTVENIPEEQRRISLLFRHTLLP